MLVAIVVVGWLLYSIYLKGLLAQGKIGQLKLALIAIGLIFLALAVTGRAPALLAIVGAAMTQVMRLAPLLIRFAPSLKRYMGSAKSGSGPGRSGSGSSKVTTATLVMSMDHASGAIDGDIVNGPFTGRTLNSLSLDELKSLHSYCATNDHDAGRLVETYAARQRAGEWTEQARNNGQHGGQAATTTGEMTVDEAKQVLGIEGAMDRKTVVAAHRSLMGRFHPDKGGNDYLATKLNTARDVLLAQLTST